MEGGVLPGVELACHAKARRREERPDGGCVAEASPTGVEVDYERWIDFSAKAIRHGAEVAITRTDWNSAAFPGMVGVRRYTLFLQSPFEFA